MPTIMHRPIDRRNPRSTWLSKFASNNTSQFGQDGIIKKIFEVAGTRNKMCCEFGAWDGYKHSNTYSLIKDNNWTAFLIEGQKDRCERILSTHTHNTNVHAINTWIEFEGENTIDNVLVKHGAPVDIDLMVIDVDGVDYHIWDSMKLIQPRVVAIEFNNVIPNDVIFIQDKDWTITQGSSLLAMQELGRQKGYELIFAKGDAFFVRTDLFHLFGILDNSLDSMFFLGKKEIKLFQGYDGKFWTAGRRKVIWSNKRDFEADSFQLIPPEDIRRHERVLELNSKKDSDK